MAQIIQNRKKQRTKLKNDFEIRRYRQKNIKVDQDQMESAKALESVNKYPYRVLVSKDSVNVNRLERGTDNDKKTQPIQNITIWNQTETLALINIFSLYKDKFKNFKKKRDQWKLISGELDKIGIHKAPEKCEIKWKNLLRVYRQHKNSNKGQGKFEFFNELDDIVSNDQQYQYLTDTTDNNPHKTGKVSNTEQVSKEHVESYGKRKLEHIQNGQRQKCSCVKSDKQKRHEDRMAVMVKKMEIEERKVKAFEEYLQYLKSSAQNT